MNKIPAPLGCDIYSGCCTLKVEYARQNELNVKRNDDMSWDYTEELAHGGQNVGSASGRTERPVLLAEPLGVGSGGSGGGGAGAGAAMSMAAMGGSAGGTSTMGGTATMGGSMGGALGVASGGMGGAGNNLTTLASVLAGMDPMKLAAVVSSIATGSILNLGVGGGVGGLANLANMGVMGGGGTENLMNNMTGIGGIGGGGLLGGGGMMGSVGMGGGGMTGGGLMGNGGMMSSGGMMGGAMMGAGGMMGTGGMMGAGMSGSNSYGVDHFDGPSGYDEGRGPVVMLYGLEPSKFNCQRLFNLLCLYGNVNRILFLKNKDGTAMVEMDSPEAVGRVVENISQTTIFGQVVRADWSKKESVNEVRQVYQLPDGSDNYFDYEYNRNNRFDTPERAARNRILPPGRELLFLNVPRLEDPELERVFTDAGAAVPVRIKWFPSSSSTKAASGVVAFETVEDAVEALVLCNHSQVEGNKGARYPFVMKLCFSEGAVRGRERVRSRDRDRSRGRDDRDDRDRSARGRGDRDEGNDRSSRDRRRDRDRRSKWDV